MPAPIIPWQPSNIPLEIQQELDRRKTVRSFEYVANNLGQWDNNNGDWKTYKGPMMPWVRICSNSAGHPAVNKPRFVFRGGKGFYDTYGFSQSSPQGSKYQIIGYMPTNPPIPHTIENSLRNPTTTRNGQKVEASNYPIHVPTPEISKVTVTVQKELYRRAEVEWTCFSWEQLVYMTPYFLIPGISIMMEWGWNHFNPASLVKLDDEKQMAKLWRYAYPLYINNIIQSRGNYDVIYGIVTNFNWSMEGNRIHCMTEITSKDRLYAGISKDMGLSVNDKQNSVDEPRPIFQALRDFVNKDATLLNLKTIAEAENPSREIAALSGDNVNNAPATGSVVHGAENQNIIWRDIIRPILSEPDKNVRAMKMPYVRGVFSGRSKKFFNESTGLGKPSKCDFDKSNVDKLSPNKVWINMGMIVEILNYFSGLPGGKGEPMFQVDIMNSVIGAHPNMISCNKAVLIPNAGAPRAHYGARGLLSFGPSKGETGTPYYDQKATPQDVKTKADETLRAVCSQIPGPHAARGSVVCFRQNLDKAINWIRYRYPSLSRRGSSNLGYDYTNVSFAFPAIERRNLPVSSTGLAGPVTNDPTAPKGNIVEENVSGLLSNIYLNYAFFIDAVTDPDPKMGSYIDVYKKILSVLNDSVDGFWDLALVEVDNIMTIVDKNFTSNLSKNKDVNPTYSFDYFDSDSIIRSFRFRPALTDAQATRAIYGEVNNSGSRYVYVDKNDLLDYKFRDAIILNADERKQGDPSDSDVAKRNTALQQMHDLQSEVQKLSTSEDDDALQMTINGNLQTIHTGGAGFGGGLGGYVPPMTQIIEVGPFEYLKLCLPSSVGKQMFRLLIDDHDEENNPRYCAIQPGITAELTILGCGGLRTFQYFLVKNLPSPYSHRDIIFRIIDVTHHISQEQAGWETKITAGILPLKKYIKTRLVPPKGGWAEVTNPTLPQ